LDEKNTSPVTPKKLTSYKGWVRVRVSRVRVRVRVMVRVRTFWKNGHKVQGLAGGITLAFGAAGRLSFFNIASSAQATDHIESYIEST
jgi:uncharacterized iron-regulated membrane protein